MNTAFKGVLVFLLCLPVCAQSEHTKLKDGDIIFQTSRSSQSQAIQLATHSKYSHMGMLFKKQRAWYVYEASARVQSTPLKTWIARGENEHYVVKRLKNASKILTPDVLAKMKAEGERFDGKPYDLAFAWSDEKLYCSELVWKIYQRGANIELGALQKLGSFDLSSKPVINKLQERYGNRIPYNEPVISPAAIFDSAELETLP
ncbi:hypothetical protein FACS1894158_15480 [Betaproteobacteria bacterium]|nr:hypothetical protein FACS1894158_15480 [Betaproteobacteria bacterium]